MMDLDFTKTMIQAALGDFHTNILMEKKPGEPSTEERCIWLYAKGIKPNKNHNPQNGGKWLLFHKKEEIDRAWEKIWQHTVAKRLGTTSKVITSLGCRNDTYVICVYTKDYEQIDDVKEVRRALKRLGYRLPIPYKSDEMTRRGESGSLYFY